MSTLNLNNQSKGDVRIIGINPIDASDTLYQAIYPAGASSCSPIDNQFVKLYVIPVGGTTTDTAVISRSESMNRPSVRVFIQPGLKLVVERTNKQFSAYC